MSFIICFSGVSGSGKTTLIEKISKELNKKGKKVSIIKNDPKNKANFDIDGKDSDRFFKTGADTIITSPKKTTFFFNKKIEINNIIKMLDFEYLLIEGYKELDFPRITVFREDIHKDYINISSSFACKNIKKDKLKLLEYKTIFDLDDIKSIIKWIEKSKYE
jgi:molybdopterin-guanine dinucleotide biosynthesis protein B